MKHWCVYIVRCRNGSLYTGITNNLLARVAAHNAGKGAKYTRAFRPVHLVYTEEGLKEGEAKKREMEIKAFSKTEKESLVKQNTSRV